MTNLNNNMAPAGAATSNEKMSVKSHLQHTGCYISFCFILFSPFQKSEDEEEEENRL